MDPLTKLETLIARYHLRINHWPDLRHTEKWSLYSECSTPDFRQWWGPTLQETIEKAWNDLEVKK